MKLEPVKFEKMEENHPKTGAVVLIRLEEDQKFCLFCKTFDGYFVPYINKTVRLDFKIVKYWKLLRNRKNGDNK